MIHAEDQALVWGRFRNQLEGKLVPPNYECRGVQKNGTMLWLEMVTSRIHYRGKPAIQGAIKDVTDRKQAGRHYERVKKDITRYLKPPLI